MFQTELIDPWLKQAFNRLIAERTGLKLRENDQEVFEAVIFSRVQKLRFSFPENYYQLLESDKEESHNEWENLISEITNSESFFFRDKGQFKLLRNRIFPKIIQEKKGDKILRICSAGCSTGEEPYSIAILLKDLMPDLQEWTVTILGVDIDSVAIKKAKRGIYRPWSFRRVDPDIKQRFFTEKNGVYYIAEDIKQMVSFQTVNLVRDSFSNLEFNLEFMDLILCRNVFIYFSDSAIETVLNKFHDALNPFGYLLVGHAELHSQKPNQFQVKLFEESVAYQRVSKTSIHPTPADFLIKNSVSSAQSPATRIDQHSLAQLFEGNNVRLQKIALNLLRQLPADTRFPKLGNLTASELIRQTENSLNSSD